MRHCRCDDAGCQIAPSRGLSGNPRDPRRFLGASSPPRQERLKPFHGTRLSRA